MPILKVKKRENYYVQVDKRSVEDKNLSFKATGLLVYLMGRPADWKVMVSHLKTCKTDGRDSIRSALLELRNNNYCHLFEVRVKGVIRDRFYYVYEIPTPYTEDVLIEVMEDFYNAPEGTSITHIPVKNNLQPKPAKPEVEKPKVDYPQTDKPLVEKPDTENPPLLIIDYTNNRVNNNRLTNKRTTTKETNKENSSSLYSFLDKKEYCDLHRATVSNIRKHIKNLSEDRFKTVYLFAKDYVQSGRGANFDAILYKALKGQWNVNVKVVQENRSVLSEDKMKWLSRYSGITCNKSLKKEIEGIICDIPIEELRKSRSTLSSLDIFQFKMFLISLKSRCRAMRV